MKSVRFTLNEIEIGAIVPGLAYITNYPVKLLRLRYWTDPQQLVPSEERIYAGQQFDSEMLAAVQSCLQKLTSLGQSCKVRLNAFEIAAAALALRVVKAQKLASAQVISAAEEAGLAAKLENMRRRAKRAAIAQLGPDVYKEQADRWGRFVQWLRANALQFGPIKPLGSYEQLRRTQCQTMRALAMEVVVESADRDKVHHLADLALSELRRGRHDTTATLLLSEHDHAKEFLAEFLLNRLDFTQIRPEFLPIAVRWSLNADKYRAAMVLDADDYEEPRPVEAVASTEGDANQSIAAAPNPAVVAVLLAPSVPNPEPTPTPRVDLANQVAQWLIDEVEPGYQKDVVDEMKNQVWFHADFHKVTTRSTNVAEIITECRHVYIKQSCGPEMTSYFAEWGARWLLAVDSHVVPVFRSIEDGARLARERWNSMDDLTRRSKLREIYRRYFL